MAGPLVTGFWLLVFGGSPQCLWRGTGLMGFKKYFLVYVYQKRKYDEHMKNDIKD